MAINFQFNINKKIVVNGRQYRSVDEMPENIRQIYMKAIEAASGADHTVNLECTTTKIVFNGKIYSSPEEMPPETRRAYELILTTVEAAKPADAAAPPPIEVEAQRKYAATFPYPRPPTNASNQSWSKWLNIILAILIAALLLYYFKMR